MVPGGNNSLSLGVHAVTSPWQEGGGTYHSGRTEKPAEPGEISWVNQPTFDFSPVASFNPGSGAGKYIEVDITPLVMAWLTGKSNYGLMIKPVGIMSGRAPESSYGFYSRERQDKSKRPILVLSGSGSVGQSGEPGDLGKSWDVTEVYGWTGRWTRQGDSNVFDALWTLGGKQEKAVLTISINGNTVNVKRKQCAGSSYPGQECTYIELLLPIT